MQEVTIDTEAYINELLADTNLASLEGHMADVSSRLEKTAGFSAVNRSSFAGTMASLLTSQKISSEVTAKMEVTASKAAALKAAENIEANIKQSYEMVDEQNQYYEDYVKELVQGAGYSWTSKESKRRVPVDSYALATIYETQYVASYQWFKTAVPEVTVSTALLGNMEGETLALAVAQDESDLEEWRKKMFSSEEGKEGEFVKWVGKGGKLKDDYDTSKSLSRNTEISGTGQMGSIILNFQWNEIMQRKGFSELGKPVWDQKLYPGEMFGMEAPSIRTVASVAAAATAAVVGAVAAPFTGGSSAVLGAVAAAAIGAAITFTNEFVFAMLDLVGEYKSPEEIGKQLAIKAATDAVSVLGAGAGAAVSGISGIAGVAARTGVSVATGATSTVATNAIQYAGDWDKFSDSMSSFDTWSGVVTSAAGSLVTNSLNGLTLGKNNIKVDGFNSSQIGSIQNLNGTIGGLASAGLSYGLTGEATFNILNISGFGAGASSGLLEMTLSRNRGVTARLGTGGTDLSYGTVSSSLAGIKALNKSIQITRAASRNNMGSAATALRTQYGFGDDKQLAQLEEILKSRAELKRGTGDGRAQTVTENGKRTVYLNSYKENMTREEQLALGITLGHEAYRDGITGDAQSQFNETAEAVLGHTALAKRMQSDSIYNDMMTGLINSDINLKSDISAFDYALATGDWGAFGSYVGNNYDYSADYWKLNRDGSLSYDGKANLYDENGKLIMKTDAKGIQGSLEEILEIDNAYYLMKQAGMRWNGKNWLNDLNSTDGSIKITSEMTVGKDKTSFSYGEIYKNRIITDSINGYSATIENQNPYNVYQNMVANGTMDIKPGYEGFFGDIKAFFKGTSKYISYEDFVEKNYITGDMPQEGKDYQTGLPIEIINGNNSLITTTFLATGNLGTHYGIDFSVPIGTEVYALFFNEKAKAKFVFNSNGNEGNYTNLNTELAYNYKGHLTNDNIVQRYMHLSRKNESFSLYFQNTPFAYSGNTGKMTTGPHLHLDISSKNGSPWLDYLSKQNKYTSYISGKGIFYNPQIFLNSKYGWKNETANTYNN